MKSKRFTETHAWRLVGLSLAMMSVFAARHGVWRNVVTALAAIGHSDIAGPGKNTLRSLMPRM